MKTIEIEGFKSIKKLQLELKPINILIGANGSGKSNFISFFKFLKEVIKQNLDNYVALNGRESILHKGSEFTNLIKASIHFEKFIYYFTLEFGVGELILKKESFSSGDLGSLVYFNSYESMVDSKARNDLFQSENLMIHHFHDTGENSPFGKESNIDNDIFYLYERGENLAAFLYHLKNEYFKSYQLIIKVIQSIAPYFNDFFLKPTPSGLIKLRWKSKYDDVVYGFNSLSDGTLRFIALTTIFLQPNLPSTIIIDEPELGLHPMALNKLSGLIKSAAKKGCQVIIATQSPELIGYFEPEDIVTVDSKNGESEFKRLSSKELKLWLEDYSLDKLWKMNIINSGQVNF